MRFLIDNALSPALAVLLRQALPQLAESFENGCIVTFEPARIRVRLLPIGARAGND